MMLVMRRAWMRGLRAEHSMPVNHRRDAAHGAITVLAGGARHEQLNRRLL